MLPKFTVHPQHDGRFQVETDWYVDSDLGPNVRTVLVLTTGGRLATSSMGWATRERAERAIKQCKARLAF